MYFGNIVIISPWKRAGPFIWTNLNPLHPRMLCTKFVWNWAIGSGEGRLLISSMYFRYFAIISAWKKGGALHLNKHESLSLTDALCQFWLKVAQWFLRRSFLKFVNVFSLSPNYLPWKGERPFIWRNLNPHHPRMLCAKFGWYRPHHGVALEKKIFIFRQWIFAIS